MNELIITNAGRALLAKLLTGKGNMTMSRFVTSSHDYSNETLENLANIEDIVTIVTDLNVITDGDTVTVNAVVSNEELSESYYLRTIGLYVNDGENEVLYAVSISDTPNYIPTKDGKAVSSMLFKLTFMVSNAEKLIINTPSNAYATMGDIKALEEVIESRKYNITPIPYGREVEREEGKLYIAETVKDSKEIVNADAVAYLRLTDTRGMQAYSYYAPGSVGTNNIHIQNNSRQIGAVSFSLPCAKKYVKSLVLTFGMADYSISSDLNLFAAPAFDEANNADLISAVPKALNCTWSNGYDNEFDKTAILKTLTPTTADGTTQYTVDLTEYLDSITDSNGKVNLIISAASEQVNGNNWVRLYPDVSEYTVDVAYDEVTGYSLEDCQGNEIDLSSDSQTYYGTCNTAAATAAKVVVCDGFTLKEGATIHVKFSNQNNASNATLNVNGTGAIAMKLNTTGSAVPAYFWQGGTVRTFVYNGTYWLATEGAATTTYYGITKLTSSFTGTSTALALNQKAGNDLNDKIEKAVGCMIPSFAISLGEGETAYTLSEYTEPGIYSFDIPSGNSKSFADGPSDVSFYGVVMEVIRSVYSKSDITWQKLFVNTGVPSTSPSIYIRSGVGNAISGNSTTIYFSEWRKMLDDKDLKTKITVSETAPSNPSDGDLWIW